MKETKICEVCGKEMSLKENYFYSRNLNKHPDGYLDTCKNCSLNGINVYNSITYLPLLAEVDIPYYKSQLDNIIDRYAHEDRLQFENAKAVFGRYISKMKLMSFRNYHFYDTALIEKIESLNRQEKAARHLLKLRHSGMPHFKISEKECDFTIWLQKIVSIAKNAIGQ